MKKLLFLFTLSICIPQNNQEYILTTNDGEFMEITSFSKQDGAMLIWHKEGIHSPVATINFIIPYSKIKNIKNMNGEIVWDKKQGKLAQVPIIGEMMKSLDNINLNPGSDVKPSINLNPNQDSRRIK